jgi:hypothetical protein
MPLNDLVSLSLKGLSELDLTPITTWRECQALYKPLVKNDDDLLKMDPVDVLTAFEDHVMSMDSQQRQNRNSKIRAIRRQERIQRDAFATLLAELKASNSR